MITEYLNFCQQTAQEAAQQGNPLTLGETLCLASPAILVVLISFGMVMVIIWGLRLR
jgi:hypothetical protein